MADAVAQVRAIYQNLKPWLLRYSGGMPAGFMAAIAKHESGGKMSSSGDPSLGEVGIFQITKSFPPSIGVPADARYDAENNVFLAGLEYNIEAAKMFVFAPRLVRLGSADSWKLARLGFAIGSGGTRTLIKNATGLNPAHAGNVFGAIRSHVNAGGAISLGSQSADKVRTRVNAIDEQWAIGARVAPLFYGPPTAVPSPKGVAYTIPKDVRPYLHSSTAQFAVVLAVTGGLLTLAGAIGGYAR